MQEHENTSKARELFVVESKHVAPFAHGLLAHSLLSTPHVPPEKPTTHVQLYACTAMLAAPVESDHVAPFTHGLLEHSSTSTSQIPSSATVHCAVYSVIKLYPAQSPFA